MRLFTDPRLARRIWDVRESSLGVTSHVPGEPLRWEGFEDSAVAPEKLGAYLRDLRKLMQAFHYGGAFYGHFGHACVHTRMDYDLQSAEGVRKFRQFMEEAADLVVSYGGSLSGEHGDGQSRAELLPKMFGPELMQAFREFKCLWDPDWKMNPGQADRAVPPRRESPPRPRLRSLAARDALQVPRRPRQPRQRHPALCRSRKVPPLRRRRDVPQLPRHPRRGTLHPRPRPPALGDDQGLRNDDRRDQRRLAERSRQTVARPLPRLQRLQKRLPGRRGRRNLQVRIPLPLLRNQPPPAERARLRQH